MQEFWRKGKKELVSSCQALRLGLVTSPWAFSLGYICPHGPKEDSHLNRWFLFSQPQKLKEEKEREGRKKNLSNGTRMSNFRSKGAEGTHIHRNFLFHHLFVCLFSKSASTVFFHYHRGPLMFLPVFFQYALWSGDEHGWITKAPKNILERRCFSLIRTGSQSRWFCAVSLKGKSYTRMSPIYRPRVT